MVGALHAYSKLTGPDPRLLKLVVKLSSNQPPAAPVVPSALPARYELLSTDKLQQLAADYRQGLKIKDLAAKYSIHRATVSIHLENLGVTKRPRSLTSTQIAEAARLYQQGQSLATIGQHFGVHASTIWNKFKGQGIPRRQTSGSTPR